MREGKAFIVPNFIKNIIMIVLTAIITLLILISGYELYNRFIWYDNWKAHYSKYGDWYGMLTIPSKDEVLMWEYRPYGVYEDSRLDYKIETNRYGFRDNDYESPDKPKGIYRVAFIGDSTTLGFKAKGEDVFVREFERLANKTIPGRNVQALNFGVDGYNTIQIFELLKTRAVTFVPDKVVYAFNLNDFDMWNASGQKVLYFKKPKLFFLREFDRFVRNRKLGKIYDYYHFYFDMNRDTVFPYIVKMRDLLREKGVDFQVVILPTFEYDFKKYAPEDLHEKIKHYLMTNNIEVFDLLQEFKKQDKPSSSYLAEPGVDNWHPNKEGHRFMAQSMLQPVLSHLLSQGMAFRSEKR